MAGDQVFAHVEYHEAANAYFKGVDIGFATLKGYVTMNALFFTLIGITAEAGNGKLTQLGTDFVSVVPIFAMAVSALMALSFGHYFRHLENCRARCAELEQQCGGELFIRLGGIAHRKGKAFSTSLGLGLIVFLFIVVWGLVALKIGTFNTFMSAARGIIG